MQLSASQQEILKQLRRSGEMTVDELSQAMGISGVAVRQHLDGLLAEAMVATRTERRRIGRPARVYYLTDAADDQFPKAYQALASMILESVHTAGGPTLVNQVFEMRRQALLADARPKVEGKTLDQKVAALAALQDEAGYMADWETAPDGSYLLREHNCAICKVARQFPQVCQKELELFQDLLDAEVTREQHMGSGGAMCEYRIRPRATRESTPRPRFGRPNRIEVSLR